jgi:hypothetical protein
MKSYKIDINDEAAGMLEEMRHMHGVIPENLIRIMIEGGLEDASTDRSLYVTYVELACCSNRGARKARLRGQDAPEMERAITHLQTAVAKRFGRDFDTDTGRGTIYISHDGASLTNPDGTIVAQRTGSIARQLTSRRGELLVA